MARRAAREHDAFDDEAPAGGASRLGGVLRGSVNSMVGAAGLNLPLRAVERLTGALENATAILQRLERATTHRDRVDADFLLRVNDTLDVLADMSEDTAAIRERLDVLEGEVRELRELIADTIDRVPVLRGARRTRTAATSRTAARR